MNWTRNLSIRWKLVLVTVFTCAIAELFVGAIVAFYSSNSYETRRSQDVAVQADVLSASLTAPLVFGDAAAAREYLDALQGEPRNRRRRRLWRARAGCSPAIRSKERRPRVVAAERAASGVDHRGDKLMVSRPVMQAGNAVGTIYLVADHRSADDAAAARRRAHVTCGHGLASDRRAALHAAQRDDFQCNPRNRACRFTRHRRAI